MCVVGGRELAPAVEPSLPVRATEVRVRSLRARGRLLTSTCVLAASHSYELMIIGAFEIMQLFALCCAKLPADGTASARI